jgi:hypothetical protein
VAGGKTHRYKWQNLPDDESEIPECSDAIVDFIMGLYRPNLSKDDKKKIGMAVKKDTAGIYRMRRI